MGYPEAAARNAVEYADATIETSGRDQRPVDAHVR